MAFKFVLFAALVAAVSAGLIPQHGHVGHASSHQSFQLHTPTHHHAAPVHHVAAVHAAPVHHVAAVHAAPVHHTIVKEVEHHAPANYEFSYAVHDEHTGDIKSQHETRHGDEVHGQYSLIDSDGYQRIVDYHADHHSGFNAVVRREPTHVKIAQPVHKVIAQPVHVHAAPVAHHSYSHAAPAVAFTSQHHAAPLAHHSYSHAAPAVAYTSQHHVAPVAHATISHVAPVAYTSGHGHGHHATSHISQISHNSHY
ncbi:cuticle protein 18.6 [Culex quinquefasciatus]|uniref:Cuticle protein 18.6 n=1 Tax=Culex quinquefasciatus TaxID=7176 RepID=B0X2M0_CULQU|nr:cuticle protein 18.6 [Culex quinquefasciatus]|eukprot:XP_001863892.1 cuticle protein 18.6 [Culex quinquefasciatus]